MLHCTVYSHSAKIVRCVLTFNIRQNVCVCGCYIGCIRKKNLINLDLSDEIDPVQ